MGSKHSASEFRPTILLFVKQNCTSQLHAWMVHSAHISEKTEQGRTSNSSCYHTPRLYAHWLSRDHDLLLCWKRTTTSVDWDIPFFITIDKDDLVEKKLTFAKSFFLKVVFINREKYLPLSNKEESITYSHPFLSLVRDLGLNGIERDFDL